MNFLDLIFYVFLPIVFIIYYVVPIKFRYLVIFVASYVFYGYSNPRMLIILVVATIISYIGGLVIYRSQHAKRIYILFFLFEILLLSFYKYTDFLIDNFNSVSAKIGLTIHLDNHINLIMPIGLSFIVFQACTYLSDVYRHRVQVEKNIIRYSAFVAFFPTVLSGPIQKAKNLIPQLKKPSHFNFEQAQKGILLFIWGLFEKIMVANKLSVVSTTITKDYLNRSSAEILIGVICFSLYIYADFSSYSDMARGISKLFGIDVGKNFNNPYLSASTSEFWNRWHVSLNEWFIDNVYIPLGGNRKGIARKYFNIMVVFLISGLWHGAHWHFVEWGLLNGVLVILGQITKPLKQKIYAFLRVNEKAESVLFIKRAIVFLIITFTWVLFSSRIKESLGIWKRIVLFDFVSIFNPALLNICGTAVTTFITLLYTVIFCVIQAKRQKEALEFEIYKRQPFFIQCLLVAIIICVVVFSVCSTDSHVDANFLYFQF